MIKEHYKFSYESLIALLQGKELHYICLDSDREFIFLPPFNGIFMTHDEICQIEYESKMGVLNILREIQIHREEANKENDNPQNINSHSHIIRDTHRRYCMGPIY